MDIDWNHLRILRKEVGTEDYTEIVKIFLEEVEEVVSRLQSLPKLEELEEDLHFLKGSALNLGFSRFSKMCQVGETKAREGEAADVDLTSIIQCFKQSRSIFKRGSQSKLTLENYTTKSTEVSSSVVSRNANPA